MSKSYVVAKGKSLFAKNDEHLLEFQEVVVGKHLPEGKVQKFLDMKVIVEVGVEEKAAEKAPAKIPATVDGDKAPLDTTTSRETEKAAIEAQEAVKKNKAPISPWVLDPVKLNGKTLQQLQVMIRERDAKAELPTTVQAARAFLSADFGKLKE
jgi:hypothetical protein